MPKVTLGEIYFVVGMMALTLVITAVSVYIFMKTYRKEMREKEERKRLEKEAAERGESGGTGRNEAQ